MAIITLTTIAIVTGIGNDYDNDGDEYNEIKIVIIKIFYKGLRRYRYY